MLVIKLNAYIMYSYTHMQYYKFSIISYTQVCQCNGNYSGYDCSRCKFGHYGPNCSQSQVLLRRPIASYTDEEWEKFIEIIRLLHSHDSGYTAILEEASPGTTNLLMTNVTLYKLYVWLHHYAAKDSIGIDKIGELPPSVSN